MNLRAVVCAIAAAGLAPAALAQWSDNFDAYPAGSIEGRGGWTGWDAAPSAAGEVSSRFARSGPNSQSISGVMDSVHEYPGITSGLWTYTTWQYIPSTFTGSTYFILMNRYAPGAAHVDGDWSVELQFIGDSGLIIDDLRTGGGPVSFVRDAWAEIRVDFDLTANTISQFYNGSLIASGTWSSTPASALALAAVDLYAGTGNAVYYDDMSVAPIPAPASIALTGAAGLIALRRRRA